MDEVKLLRRDDRDDAAEQLLLELVQAVEEEARVLGVGVAPWYYEQLAIIYRKRKDDDSEIGLLERYSRQPPAPGASAERLAQRLAKARARRGDA